MRLNQTAAPAVEPVSLDEVKLHCRIDGNDENALLTALIAAARRQAENYCGRALITQVWEMVLDGVGGAEIWVPLPPLQAVVKIEVISGDGTKTVISDTLYDVETSRGRPGRVRLKSGCAWPTHRGFASFIVTFRSGYGDAAADVPAPIREAVKQYVAHLYEHRGDGEAGVTLSTTVQALLQPYRIIGF